MSDALVGSTGFVGRNLSAVHAFGAGFHSRNIADISGRSFDTVVCAAAPATMWAANKDPEGDLANIRRLIGHLETVTAGRFVLVSTIAVLEDAAAGLDEGTQRFETAKAYGRNRRLLEAACQSLFPRTHVLRLPALFGRELKKNFLFDILNPVPSFLPPARFDALAARLPEPAARVLREAYAMADEVGMYRCDRARLAGPAGETLTRALFAAGFTALDFTHADSRYQYYGLARLWDDIGRVIDHEIGVMHLAPEPVGAGEVYAALTGQALESRSAPLYREDMRTRHAGLWDGPPGYIQSRAEVLAALKAFHAAAATP